MSLATRNQNDSNFQLPAEVDWHMLDKSRFFVLGAALFSAVSGALYPAVVLKTRQQVSMSSTRCSELAFTILRREGVKSFYRGFTTSLMGTVPARALYMTALEVTKTTVAGAGAPTAVASAAAGLSASIAAQLVWTPVDVVSQKLMVSGKPLTGVDCFHKILRRDGIKGLYRGFGVSILTYAPSSALWWGSYSMAHNVIWAGLRIGPGKWEMNEGLVSVGVQGVSAAAASGVSAMVTTPFDTVKTRMQVAEGERRTMAQTVRGLVREGGFVACYRGIGPRWASMSMSSATMVTTYELLKKLSAKHQEKYYY